jgi:protein-export membrane protein SecD
LVEAWSYASQFYLDHDAVSGSAWKQALGTALDANILINERIREEVKNGRSPINALEIGYTKASGTILDSNLTNLIAMACLYGFGSGPVKGFAVTVAIGTVVQMWTATVLTRLMVVWWYRARRP